MKPSDFRICPACQARNKAKWEFCVRCSESLQDVPLESKTPAAATGGAEVAAAPEASGLRFWATTVAGLALLIAGAIVAARYWTGPEPVGAGLLLPVPPTRLAQSSLTPLPRVPGRGHLAAARELIRKGDLTGALGEFEAALREAPNDAEAHSAYALALWQSGSQDAAIDHYRDAVRLLPRSVQYRLDLARALVSSGNVPAALEAYEAAVDADANSPVALRELSNLYTQAGNPKKAAELMARAATLVPNFTVLQELGGKLEKLADRAAAIAAFKRAVDANPQAYALRGHVAELLFVDGKRDDAVNYVRAAMEKNPQVAEFHRDLASFLERSGRLSEAAAEYREYAKLAPSAPDSKSLSERAAALEEQASSRS